MSKKEKDRVVYQICKKKGHIALSCHNRHNEQLYPTPPESKASQAAFTKRIATQAQANALWYPDSGATDHVTPNVQNLQVMREHTAHPSIVVANGDSLTEPCFENPNWTNNWLVTSIEMEKAMDSTK